MRRPRGTAAGCGRRRARHEHRARLPDGRLAGPEARRADTGAARAAESEARLDAAAAVRAGELAAAPGAGPPVGLAGAGAWSPGACRRRWRGAPPPAGQRVGRQLKRHRRRHLGRIIPGDAALGLCAHPGRVAQLARADRGRHRRRHAAERRGRQHGPGRFAADRRFRRPRRWGRAPGQVGLSSFPQPRQNL